MNDDDRCKAENLRSQIDQEVGNAHRRYELDMLFVFRMPSVKGLTVLLLRAEMPPLANGARVRCLVI
jgi:hypothetical protein